MPAAPSNARTPTPEQQAAIDAVGNVLVMAGAGTGKTSTLVQRCLAHLQRPQDPLSLDQLLLVTFTEAAASEMRQRLRAALESQLAEHPTHAWWMEQLALVDTARISTLHGLCLQLVRDHFHELELDPDLTVLAQDQAQVLMRETLERLLLQHLANNSETAHAVQALVLGYARGWDRRIQEWVLQLHHYTQTRSDPEGWFDQQLSMLDQPDPVHWRKWFGAGFASWRDLWLPELRSHEQNEKAAAAAALLGELPQEPDPDAVARSLNSLLDLDTHWPRGTKTRLRPALERFFADAQFLHSLTAQPNNQDPLAQDWAWTRPHLRTLLELAREFTRRYTASKRELGAADFHDLEQLALDLLWDRKHQAPTTLAQRWRTDIREILVDEYQDINAAQDALIRALGRDGAEANRFLVGDVKQSIYRFRLADPGIFQSYAHEWNEPGQAGQVLSLTGNFRSQPPLLEFTNHLFSSLMQPVLGGLAYSEDQWLRPGPKLHSPNPSDRSEPNIEFHLAVCPDSREDPEPSSAAEREARLVARRIAQLVTNRSQVRDRDSGAYRAIEWDDIAILLRSPRTRAEAYARVFAQVGIPLQTTRGGFYGALEVSDLLSLLQILDNPRQDLPLLAVLRSPLAGFTAEELVELRLTRRRGPLWPALRELVRQKGDPGKHSAWAKAQGFLQAYQQWRTLSRVASLSECLETVLEDTAYEAWLAAQPAPEQALANVRRFLALTRQFDQFQRQGLHRFLRFVEAQQDAAIDPEPASATPSRAVRLLSVHQSKGLEFPVVVLADLGKRFNLQDLRSQIILDEIYGACPLVQPPDHPQRYPSLPHWLAAQRQHSESLGEEIRLLYVACTRARDHLILCGTTHNKQLEERWPNAQPKTTAVQLLSANSWLDWIGPWWSTHLGLESAENSPGSRAVSLHVHIPDDPWLAPPGPNSDAPTPTSDRHSESPRQSLPADVHRQLHERFTAVYAHLAATREPAKASVSQLRSRAHEDTKGETRVLFVGTRPADDTTPEGLSAAARGSAHHLVLEALPLDHPVTQGRLLQTVHQLREHQVLAPNEAEALDLTALLDFWRSDLGIRIQQQHAHLHRELPFTARFTPAELRRLSIPTDTELDPTEYIVVQGVVDLAVILPHEVWILDFKTDRLTEHDLQARAHRYRPQLALYAQALGTIYRRPVSEQWLHFLQVRRSLGLHSNPG